MQPPEWLAKAPSSRESRFETTPVGYPVDAPGRYFASPQYSTLRPAKLDTFKNLRVEVCLRR